MSIIGGKNFKSDKFKELGLKEMRFHDLRHFSLTLLIRAAHSTFNIYGHALMEEERKATELIGNLFNKTDK